MKKQEWNEEQLEQLLQQLPSVKDKQNQNDLSQSIYYKYQNRKKRRNWIAPTVATVAALFIFALISPFLFQGVTNTSEESAMDMASTSSSESSKAENDPQAEMSVTESSIAEDKSNENVDFHQKLFENEQETFVTDADDSDKILTVGLIDEDLQNIIPISIEEEAGKEELDQIKAFKPEKFVTQFGPLVLGLKNTDIEEENNEEIIINYKADKSSITGSGSEIAYRESIIETFRWLGYKKANLFTNGVEGIEFSNYGQETELEITETRNKAYLVYQYDDSKAKLLVPTRESLPSIKEAINIMKKGIDEQELKPSIQNNIGEIEITEDGEHLEIQFTENANVENNEASIIMLESILLTAKDFGYETVQFNGTKAKEIGVMDVTKPLEVPFSPNPIKEDE